VTDAPALEEPDFGTLHEVRLLRLPVQVWEQSQEHSDELFREFALIAADPDAAPATPRRLTQLVDDLTKMYSGLSDDQQGQLFAAAEAGVVELDLLFQVPAAVSQACHVLDQLLDEADEFCSQGQHLLTLTTPPELRRFRRWYLDQFTEQIAGRAPVPWPEYAGR
jgi:hypothetical protein